MSAIQQNRKTKKKVGKKSAASVEAEEETATRDFPK